MSAHACGIPPAIPEPALRPARALLHPVWLLALATLALNDHVLKGAGLLPGLITGKLSDVAGLIVAPVVLAVLLRVGSRRGLWACCAAVGAVFSALQLSPAAAGLWSDLTGLLGMPWTTISDAADLLALPALMVIHVVLVPAMRRPLSTRPRLKLARGSALGAGVVFCLASSPPPENPQPLPPDQACQDDAGNVGRCDAELCWNAYGQAVYCDRIQCDLAEWQGTSSCPLSAEQECAQLGGEWDGGGCMPACLGERNSLDTCVFPNEDVALFLYNATDETALMRVLALAPSVQLDCTAVALVPARHLKRTLFVAAGSWVLGPGQVRPLQSGTTGRACGAVVIGTGVMREQLVFWSGSQTETVWDEPEAQLLNSYQGVALTETGEGPSITALQANVQVRPLTAAPRAEEVAALCGGPPDSHRLAWSESLATDRPYRIEAIDASLDGCLGLSLLPVEDEWAAPERWYLCVDPERFPFLPGDVIERAPVLLPDSVLTLRRLDPDGGDGSSAESASTLQLHLLRQPGPNTLASLGLRVALEPWADCPAQAEPSCGTVTQMAALAITDLESADTATLSAGESAAFGHPDGGALALDVLRAEVRPVVAAACSEGPDTIGADIELLVLEHTADPVPGEEETP